MVAVLLGTVVLVLAACLYGGYRMEQALEQAIREATDPDD